MHPLARSQGRMHGFNMKYLSQHGGPCNTVIPAAHMHIPRVCTQHRIYMPRVLTLEQLECSVFTQHRWDLHQLRALGPL